MQHRPLFITALAGVALLLSALPASASRAAGSGDAACGTSDAVTGGAPANIDALIGQWAVTSIGALDTTAIGPTIEFTADGTVHGFAGVNRFNGTYAATDGEIEFGPMMSTMMAGPDDAMTVEQCLLLALVDTQSATIGDGVLTIGSGGTAVTARPTADTAPAVVVVGGTVTYLERMALPDGAVVTIQINDVSLADAPSVTVAEAVITPFHQVPIPYAVAVMGSAFEDGHRYSLSVRISIDDELLFTSTEHLPVTADVGFQTIDVLVSSASG